MFSGRAVMVARSQKNKCIKAVRAARKRGSGTQAVESWARELRVSSGTVYKWCRGQHLGLRNKGTLKSHEKRQIATMIAQGKTDQQIARKVNRHSSAVYHYRNKLKFEKSENAKIARNRTESMLRSWKRPAGMKELVEEIRAKKKRV